MSLVVKKLYFAIIFLLLFSLMMSSCNRSDDSGKGVSVKSDVVIASEKGDTLVFGEARKKKTTTVVSPEEQRGFTETEQGDVKGQLFPIISPAIIPEDMIIGSLLDLDTLDVQDDLLVDSVITFFNGLMKGEINEDVLHPSWRSDIIKLYKDNILKINYSIRIGTVINENGIRRANIRLISDKGRVSGDIMADNYEGRWLISSIFLDMNQLETTYFRENMEFTPVSYSNILLNY